MRKNVGYKNFEKYVLRTPLLSVNFYKNLTKNKIITDKDFKIICSDKIIMEALFLASPSLFFEIERWLKGDVTNKKEAAKIKYALLKYLSRMSSRCTPFGLFAGTSIGTFSDETKIELKDNSKNNRHTRLDMNYLVALSQDLIKNDEVQKKLLFYPNSSIYEVGEQLRYIEYHYVNSKRNHQIVAVDNSEYLQKILKKTAKGAMLNELTKVLVNDEITIDDANEYINELVESQVLISELEPSVSGPEFLDQILPVLRKRKAPKAIITQLETAQKKIEDIDLKLGHSTEVYVKLSESLKKLKTSFELKYMFQTDMTITSERNELSSEIINKIKKGLLLLNKTALPPQETTLSRFGKALYKRYENREVLLSKALDVEIGIGYRQDQGSGDISSLIDDLILPQNAENKAYDIKWSQNNSILHKKLIESIKKNKYTITLKDDDYESSDVKWNDLPDTISAMIEIVEFNNNQKIVLKGIGGSSAANLLGRFCHGDTNLLEHTQEIIDTEEKMSENKILAEIVHLPESRVGNVLMRPVFRKFEIPYLAKSILNDKNQIKLNDLWISAKSNGEVLLRSKKHKKEIIPHLTNAHNFYSNSLPIYNFLAAMQTQGKKQSIGFSWGPLEEEYDFLPRVEYEDIIFSKASWNIRRTQMDNLFNRINDDNDLLKEVKKWKETNKLPQYVLLIDSDNELLINLNNLTSIRMLLSTVSKREKFKLSEFLFSDDGIVKEGGNYYANQIIVSFYNQQRLNKAVQ